MSSIEICNEIEMHLDKEGKNEGNSCEVLAQLALYLKRETNQQLFSVLEFILNNAEGVSYSQIAENFGIDIINASHYCCRLKKMKFIGWKHHKDGLLVFPARQKVTN